MAVLTKGSSLRSITWGDHHVTVGLGEVIEIVVDELPGPMGDYLVAVVKYDGIRTIVPLHQVSAIRVVP